ncbi:MAG: DivIVA domain-containing protein [Clostridia bacterium]|nr:DivIVA domain-containing protein [Clostridia bacterium]
MNCKYGFKVVRKGYDPAEVDAYIDTQLERMTAMQEQNSALRSKLAEAQDMIRHYSATEKALRSSIAQSKRGAADMLSDARERSTNLVDTARVECNRIVDELDAKIEERYKTLDEIKASVVRFKQELFQLYSDHIEMVEVLAETAENFNYAPDFTVLSEAIDSFEKAAENDAEPEVPEFPEYPEEGMFATVTEEAEAEVAEEDEAEPVASALEFGFEEADQTEAESEVEAEAAVEAEVEEETDEMFFEISEEEMKAAEALFDEEAVPAAAESEDEAEEFEEVEEITDDVDNDDDMFITDEKEIKEKEELFNFLKDFVNGSEE